MIARRLAAAAAFALAAAAGPAAAQEVPQQQSGRYQLFQAEIQSDDEGANFPILLDTQSGRTWVLVKKNGAMTWQTLPVGRLNALPDDQLTRPMATLPPESLKK